MSPKLESARVQTQDRQRLTKAKVKRGRGKGMRKPHKTIEPRRMPLRRVVGSEVESRELLALRAMLRSIAPNHPECRRAIVITLQPLTEDQA